MVLGYDNPEQVPHFVEIAWNKHKDDFDALWNYADKITEEWLHSLPYPLHPFVIHIQKDSVEDVLAYMGIVNPNVTWILGGISKNGTGHVVVCKGGEIIADPAIDNSGVVGPYEDQAFTITVLTPYC